MNSWVLKVTICILAVFLPASAQPGKLDQDQITRIDDAVAVEIERQNLVGVGIGVISGGEIAYCKGYGFANRKEEIKFTTETVTNWASNSKPVVAVAALQLVEKGLLSLNEPVRTYLPELPLDYQDITIRHLLCHQSGYPHYSNGKIIRLKNNSLGADKMDPLYSLRRFGASPLIYKPGEKYSYSSYAYVILSAVVQRAGKQALMEQLDERILQPLKITSFELDVPYRNQKLWSVGYKRLGPTVIRVPDSANDWKHGAGAYKTNIVDFAKWAQALMNGGLLSDKMKAAMWTPQKTSDGKSTKVGLGVFVSNRGGVKKISHNGSHSEARSQMDLFPDKKLGVVVLTNCGHADTAKISTAVRRALTN